MPWGLILKIAGPLLLAGAAWLWFDGLLEDREALGEGRGRAEVQGRWDRETAARAALALTAERDKAAKEDADRKAAKESADEQARLAGDLDAARAAAGTAREQLRIALNTLRSTATGGGAVPAVGTACARSDAATATAIELFQGCRERRQALDDEAAGLARQVIGLQADVRRAQSVCGITGVQ